MGQGENDNGAVPTPQQVVALFESEIDSDIEHITGTVTNALRQVPGASRDLLTRQLHIVTNALLTIRSEITRVG